MVPTFSTPQELLIGAAVTFTAVAVDAVIPTDPSNLLMVIVEKFGIVFGLLAYFIVRDYWRYIDDKKDKALMLGQVERLNTYIHKRLETQVVANNEHLKKHAELTDSLIKLVESR